MHGVSLFIMKTYRKCCKIFHLKPINNEIVHIICFCSRSLRSLD